MDVIHNVNDRRHGWIGAWEAEPLDYAKLSAADVGRTVIYRDHGRAEAGTLTSWSNGIVFARYSRGDTAAGADAAALVFGLRRADQHPNTPPAGHQKRPVCSKCGKKLPGLVPNDETDIVCFACDNPKRGTGK